MRIGVIDGRDDVGSTPNPLYQAAMRAHAALGHLDAVRTLQQTLTRRLADIDTEPSSDVVTLAGNLQRHHVQARGTADQGR